MAHVMGVRQQNVVAIGLFERKREDRDAHMDYETSASALKWT